MTQVLIIGGSDAGISAALRIREMAPDATVTVMLADDYPNFSICGLPFYLSGEVNDWRNLAHRTKEDILCEGIQLLTQHHATAIDSAQKLVTAIDSKGETIQVPYDRLILGTGATSRHPRIDGIDLPGVYFLRWMGDSFKIHEHLITRNPTSAVVIGGGYIGLEMADALTIKGIKVTLVEHSPRVLKTVHDSFGERVEDELKQHGLNVFTGIGVEQIEQVGDQLRVVGSPNFSTKADLVLVAVGAIPATELAETAGITLGIGRAVEVNQRMETNVPDIYAAGDCVHTWHQLLQKPVYLPLGTTAHKQGRVAGENAVGGQRDYQGTLGTQAVKVFELAVARTGLREAEAKDAGYEPLTAAFETWDHKVYYPGAHPIQIRITGDRNTKLLLGAQIISHYQGAIAKRVDIFASAIFHRMTVDQISDLDLSYTPPLSSPWDPVQMATQAWCKEAARLEQSAVSVV
ncbi:MAG: FAD-dependent oxidoreductase [Cyanobacteria bacterium P01_H01_bin.21]